LLFSVTQLLQTALMVCHAGYFYKNISMNIKNNMLSLDHLLMHYMSTLKVKPH